MVLQVASIIKEGAELIKAARDIQKVVNVAKDIKKVAESEGSDQVVSTVELASKTGDVPKGNLEDKDVLSKGHNKNKDLPTLSTESVFVEKFEDPKLGQEMEAYHGKFNDGESFVDTFPDASSTTFFKENPQDVFIEEFKKVESPQLECNNAAEIDKPENVEHQGITDEDKKEIKEKTGWSDKIVDYIRSKEEAQIYIDAGLEEGEVNGKPALIQPKIDGSEYNEKKWPDWSNKDLAEDGYPPRDKNGRPYELHHIGQNPDSPLAELTYEQHHGEGNFKILHTFDESSIDRMEFNKERREYWKERSKTL